VKTYQQFCGVAKALDVLGERWTLLIVRDLLLGPRRFTDLAAGLPGITPNLLAKRLKHLAEHGLAQRVDTSGLRGGQAYALTPEGRTLEPVILALGAFGSRYLIKPAPGEHLDPRSAMVSLKRRYRGTEQAGTVAVLFGDARFGVKFGGASIEVHDGSPERADVTLEGGFLGWFPLLSGRSSLRQLEQQGLLLRIGPARVAQAFVKSIGGLA
jgi:DNA-binding HxlR family transcriptional regulator